jgi:hypothetical protein
MTREFQTNPKLNLLGKNQVVGFLIVHYYYKKLKLKKICKMKIKGPFVIVIIFDGTPIQL